MSLHPAVVILLSSAVMACQSSSSGGGLASVSALVGPEGGVLTAPDGTRVDVPAGALPAVATLTLEPSSASPPPGATFASAAWTLEPTWLQFAHPITVTFPADVASLDGGPIVLTTAASLSGYQALAATAVDPSHVAAQSTHFATGAAATASCPADCDAGADPVGQTLRCAATCVGHAYVMSCSGPLGAPASCTCSIDGVVTVAATVDAGEGGLTDAIYATQCGFPATSWTKGM